MKIDYTMQGTKYYDIQGTEIHDGDIVIMDGKRKKVYATENGYLGTDSTNPAWIEKGWATECQYGIYPFDESDEPILIEK